MKKMLWGCVLIGGKSSRMGRPKHLIRNGGKTWVENIVAELDGQVAGCVLSGQGDVPVPLQHLPHVSDPPYLVGPLAGIISVMRWNKEVSWVVIGCDQPAVSTEALEWLIQQRSSFYHAILPTLDGQRVEPLCALYESTCLPFLERMVEQQEFRLSQLMAQCPVYSPVVPVALHFAWQNINTPSQLKTFLS
jgi:molybdopterin-guanine dinucleotide biosynthesis protein A